jgi:murein DD-endopeptidase MepM/ murein hydrolase activator NlpD
MDRDSEQSKDKYLNQTIQSKEAQKELEQLVDQSIAKLSSSDLHSEMEELFRRREEQRAMERESYYMTRGQRKRSAQKRKERAEAAAIAAKEKKEEKARKKAAVKAAKEARKASRKAVEDRRRDRDKKTLARIQEEEKSEDLKESADFEKASAAMNADSPASRQHQAEGEELKIFHKPSFRDSMAGNREKQIPVRKKTYFTKEEPKGFGQEEAVVKRTTVRLPDSITPPQKTKEKNRFFIFAEKEKDVETPVPKRRREGVFHRIYRFTKTVRSRRDKMKGKAYYTAEKKRAVYAAVFSDCFSPLSDAWEDFFDTGWNYLCTVARDSWAICLFISDIALKLAFYLWSGVLSVWDLIWDARYWVEANKIEFLKKFVVLVASTAGIAIIFGSVTAFEYIYYGKVLGVAKSKSDVYRTIEVLGDKLSEASGTNVSLDVERDIEFRRVMGLNLDIDTDDDILNTLTYMKDLQVRAYAIFVNDVVQVVLENEEKASAILRSIQNAYAGQRDGVEYSSISFGETVTIQEVGVQLGEIWNREDAELYLKTGAKSQVTHQVKQGETFGQIAKAYGLTTTELAASNPEINPNKIYVGQELSLAYGAPLITIHSTEIATYDEKIPYGTQYIDNASIYQGETEIKSRGIFGKQRIVAEVVRTNGMEVSRKIQSSDKLSDPVDEVLYRGTKPIPPKEGTGTFAYPIRTYTITSRFGMRWGRMHTGVDFAAATGTKIYASDGGTVTYAGWKTGYGYMLIINHGSLYETYYAHCSKLLVGAGDKIYQGQNIALVGSTGNSTGPHLHFEIRYHDKPKNPLDIL